jgi:hypothetical protein
MKKICILVLSVLLGHFSLMAQKTIAGIHPEQSYPPSSQVFSPGCDTIFSFPTIDPMPVGLAFDGNYLYSGGHFTNVIYKFRLNGQMADTLPLPGTSKGDMDFDGRYLWMVSEQDARIFKMDTANGNVVTSFAIPTGYPFDPNDYGCAWDNGYIWITEYVDQTLMRISASTGALVDSFAIHRTVLPVKVINGALYGVEFVNGSLYNMQLDKFDRTTGAVVDSMPWCLHYGLGLCRAGSNIWGLSSGAGYGTQRIYKFALGFLGINDPVPPEDPVSVFPNPADDHITIRTPGKSTVEILNINGQLLQTIPDAGTEITLDVSDLPGGVYLIRVSTTSGTTVRKLIRG